MLQPEAVLDFCLTRQETASLYRFLFFSFLSFSFLDSTLIPLILKEGIPFKPLFFFTELYLNCFHLLHFERIRKGTRWQFQLVQGGKPLDGHFSRLIQKLLNTDHSISEPIFASGAVSPGNQQKNHC